MHPILFKLGPVTLYTYGALLAVGAALGLFVLGRLAKSAGLNPDRVSSLALWSLLAGLAGSRLAFVLLEPQYFAGEPLRIFYIWDGGLVFYGGIFAALPLGLGLARRWHMPLLPMMDCFAPALALGQALGRLGCFMAGCCYGQPSDGFCAVTFSNPQTLAPRDIPLHPTQLYSSFELFALFGFLLWLWPRRRFGGQIFFTYGLVHGIARVVIEQLRGDYRGEPLFWDITPTAIFALALAVFSAIMLFYLRRRAKADNPT